MVIQTLKTCYFEAIEDITTKFKSQALHIIRTKYSRASGSGNPPSFISTLWKIAIYVLIMKFYVCTTLHTTVLQYIRLETKNRFHASRHVVLCSSNKQTTF